MCCDHRVLVMFSTVRSPQDGGVVFRTSESRSAPSLGWAFARTFEAMYELLVVVHILSAMVWVGGAIVLLLSFRGLKRADGQAAVDETMGRLEPVMNRVFLPAPILVIATGLAMVSISEAWAFSQTWVYLAVGLFVVVLIMGGGFGDRMERRMKEAREDGRSLPDVFDRYLRLGFIEMGVIVVIVFLMVYKPI